MASVDLLPIGDWRNDGWVLVGATNLYKAWDNDDDGKYAKCPPSKGGATVTFPIDMSSVPDGAVITSVTVLLRANKTGSANRSVTINVISDDDESRYTSRTIHLTPTPTTYEVGTYTRDPRGQNWDVHRLNKMRFRLFSYSKVFDAIRCYKFFARVNYHVRPTVTIQRPTGTVYTSTPVIAWTYTQADGDPQAKFDYKIFTGFQVNQANFNPASTPPVFARTIGGNVSSLKLPTSINPDRYYVYVRVHSSFGAVSTWVGRQFTVKGPAPAIPGNDNAGVSGTPGIGVVTVVPDSHNSAAALTMRDASNLLSVQQADFEVSADALEYTTAHCTLGRETVTVFDPSEVSLRMTNTDTLAMHALSTMIEVERGAPITARVQCRAATTARTINLSVQFYDEEYSSVGGTITASGGDTNTTWQEVVVTGKTHANAVHAQLKIEVAGTLTTGEIHYFDHVGLAYGPNSAWGHGGHMSRNLLTSFQATADNPASGTGWAAANIASTVARPAVTGTPVGRHGNNMFQMTYSGVTPTIGYRATGTAWTSPTNGADFSLNKPTGTLDNDLLIAFVQSAGAATIFPPSGWTLVNTVTIEGNHQMWVLKRTAQTADPATWTDGALSATSLRRSSVVVAYSGAAHADDQFVAENVKADPEGNLEHTTSTINNTDANAWRVAAFTAHDNVAGGGFTANQDPPGGSKKISFVGKSSKWVSSTERTTYTLNRPTGVQQGDLMIASCTFSSSNGPSIGTVTPPTGWTLVRKANQTDVAANLTVAILKRTAGASEPASWTTGTLSSSARPIMTQVVAYRNAADASEQFVDDAIGTSASGDNMGTPQITNTDSAAWRICTFAMTAPDASFWTSSDVVSRFDDSVETTTADITAAVFDSNGSVGTGTHAIIGLGHMSWYSAAAWIGLIKPVAVPPPNGPDETQRVDFVNGSADPWTTLAVFDSNGVVPAGQTSVTGVYTPGGANLAENVMSWVGLIAPASVAREGEVAAYTTSLLDLSEVDPFAVFLTGTKVTIMASFTGSSAGTPYLALEFYRANQLINTLVDEGESFETTGWRKSVATFDLPAGTTRIRPVISVMDREIGDVVNFDKISVALGSSPVWRNGTARKEHPILSYPEIEYAEDDGTGYGEWMPLPGVAVHPPSYDPLTGQCVYIDNTVVPLFNRRYRIQTVTLGLGGDRFVSGWSPASDEVSFTAANWWLKDIANPDDNMTLRVRWEPIAVGTANTAVAFQPLGEDYPIVLTEGYKADAVELTVMTTPAEHAALKRLLKSGRTLLLQSDVDEVWWVRPVGDLKSEIQATSQRQTKPLRWDTITFVQVAPEL